MGLESRRLCGSIGRAAGRRGVVLALDGGGRGGFSLARLAAAVLRPTGVGLEDDDDISKMESGWWYSVSCGG